MNYFQILFGLYKLKSNTRKTEKQIKKLQQKKLRKMLNYAYNNSDYYRRAFEAAGINAANIDDTPLEKFPTIDKRGLLDNFDKLITVSDITQAELRKFDENTEKDRRAFKGKYHLVHSSGSTGTPGYFVYDKSAWDSMLTGIIRAALWGMSMPQILKLLAGKPRIAYIAATDGRYGGAMAVGDGTTGVGAKQIYLDIKTPLSDWVKIIGEFKPNMLIGYPSAIKILGELVENGEIEVSAMRVVTCGEPLGASMRHYLENIFKAEVINFYGASESLALGVESNHDEGMILFDDMNVIETIGGNMYLTSLYNFAQPLIRYRLTDSLTMQNADERCPFTRAIGLLGRSEDVMWFESDDGRREFLHPLAVEGFCVEGLIDYQFVQLGRSAFAIRAQISGGVSEDMVKDMIYDQVSSVLKAKNLEFVRFYIKFTEEIRPDPITGKKQLICKKYDEGEHNMKTINGKIFDEERALYGERDIIVRDCKFDGPADGESAFKECKGVTAEDCFFNLRYPFWHDDGLKIIGSEMTELCRAALWYSHDIVIENTDLHGIKALRECGNVKMNGCDIISPEFGWSVNGLEMTDCTAESEYFMMRSNDLRFKNVKFKGKYSFQYIENSVFENCVFDTKDAFWHAKNVTVKNCVVKGEYLAWYCENVTFDHCKIIGTQPLCYCKGLKLIECEMIDTDLAFEKSEVEACVTTDILSVKNPLSGKICAPSVGEIIRDDDNSHGEIIICGDCRCA